MALKILGSIKEKSIKELLHTSLSGWEEPRDHGVIHASDLLKDGGICPRQVAFYDLEVVKKKGQFISTSMQLTFDFGRYAEISIRNRWLRKYAVGNWKCNVCGEPYQYGKAPLVHCSHCGFKKWLYQEYTVFSQESGISGSLDMLVDTGAEKLRVVEIKTLDKDLFRDLKAPMAEHSFRTNLYLRLAEESDCHLSERVDLQKATIIYMAKSFGFKDGEIKSYGVGDASFSPFKEFVIHRDDSVTQPYVARATVLHKWRAISNTSYGLPCGVCKDNLTKRAHSCPARKVCFSGEYVGRYTWLEDGKPKHSDKAVL